MPACAMLVALAGRAEAHARAIAVLEYRAGVTALPGLGDRLASVLGRATSLQVVGPAEARRRLPRVDERVARCAGDPRCVADLGSKLAVQEVLLVGLSQLGDVVLALQRVVVADAQVAAREAESLAPRASPSDGDLMRYLQALLPAEDFVRFGEIRVSATPAGARVFLDGQPRGALPLSPLRVRAPSQYTVRVAKAGFSDFTVKLDVPPEGVVEVNPTLQPLAEPAAWWRRWWIWAAAGAVVATTAIVIAASSGGSSRVEVVIQR